MQARAVVLIIKPIVFLKSSMWSSSLLLKLPITAMIAKKEHD